MVADPKGRVELPELGIAVDTSFYHRSDSLGACTAWMCYSRSSLVAASGDLTNNLSEF